MTTAPFRLGAVVGGVQKGGTTSLFGYMRGHPGLLAPSRKEVHWFDDETIDWSAPDMGVLEGFFPAKPAGRMPFDVTPIYLFWPPSLERIRAHNPHARLIFIFRDPIERAWSHWRMERRRNAEDLPFHAAIRQGRRRLEGIDPLAHAWRVYSYVERGFYARQLCRLFEMFPRDQVLLLRSDDLRRDHRAVLARIAAFLGIDPFPDMPARRDHEAPDDDARLGEEDVAYLRALYRDDVLDFSRISGLRVDDWTVMREP